MAPFGNFHQETGAGWSVYWRISQAQGGGLEIWWADFQGRRVMWTGTQPFAIVPYHRPVIEPKPPEYTYKDGLNPQCGGAPFTALKHTAPNSIAPWTTSIHDAAVDTDVDVRVRVVEQLRNERGDGLHGRRSGDDDLAAAAAGGAARRSRAAVAAARGREQRECQRAGQEGGGSCSDLHTISPRRERTSHVPPTVGRGGIRPVARR